MRKVGKIGQKLIDQREQWFIDNPAPYYECIYCLFVGLPTCLEEKYVNIEHGMSKTRHPGLRFVKGNLYVSCPGHNEQKGSMDIDEFLEILKREMENHG